MNIAFFILLLATGVLIVVTGLLSNYQERIKHACGWIFASQIASLLCLTAAVHIAMAEGWF